MYIFGDMEGENKTKIVPVVPDVFISGIPKLGYHDNIVEDQHASPRVVKSIEHMKQALTSMESIIIQQNEVIRYLMDNMTFEKRKLNENG